MIAIDTNVLIRYLVRDDAEQAEAARALLVELSSERPGFICREVTIEVVWVLERAYRLPRDEIASLLDELIATEGLIVEAADAVTQAASAYRPGRRRLLGPDDSCGGQTGRSAARSIPLTAPLRGWQERHWWKARQGGRSL